MIGVEVAAGVTIQKSFNSKRLLANGIFTSGTGFGIIVLGPFIQWLLSYYGLHGTFLILSGITLHGIICGLLIPHSLPDSNKITEEQTSYELLSKSKDELERENDIELIENVRNQNEESVEDNENQPFNLTSSKTKPPKTYQSGETLEKENSTHNQTNNGYIRLFRNKYFLIYLIGTILSFNGIKSVIGEYCGIDIGN